MLLSDEAELVRDARSGDAAAWESLVRAYQENVFRLAYLFLGDADEAEDVAQETFLRAYQALESYDTARPLRPWLLSITANLSRNRRRSLGRYLNSLKRLVYSEPTTESTIEEQSHQRLQSQRLWSAIRRLEPVDQQVIYLRYFLDLPVKETAEVMGVATGTVKSRLNRSMERLRKVISADYPDLKDTVI